MTSVTIDEFLAVLAFGWVTYLSLSFLLDGILYEMEDTSPLTDRERDLIDGFDDDDDE